LDRAKVVKLTPFHNLEFLRHQFLISRLFSYHSIKNSLFISMNQFAFGEDNFCEEGDVIWFRCMEDKMLKYSYDGEAFVPFMNW